MSERLGHSVHQTLKLPGYRQQIFPDLVRRSPLPGSPLWSFLAPASDPTQGELEDLTGLLRNLVWSLPPHLCSFLSLKWTITSCYKVKNYLVNLYFRYSRHRLWHVGSVLKYLEMSEREGRGERERR